MKSPTDYINEIKFCKNCKKDLPFKKFRTTKQCYIKTYCIKCENLIRNRKRRETLLKANPQNYLECDSCDLIFRAKLKKCPECFPLFTRPKVITENITEAKFSFFTKTIPEIIHLSQVIRNNNTSICLLCLFGKQKVSQDTIIKLRDFSNSSRVTILLTESYYYKFRNKKRIL